MSAKIIENRITDFTAERPKVAKKKVSIWTVAATLGFVGSGLCLFLVGGLDHIGPVERSTGR